ncbi:MAG TPA: sodium:calcium antiporter, partial [bacterium]|nr:sodium:calcium antiporter [bacterium]
QGLALILIGFSYLMFDYWWLVSGRHKTMAAAESAPDQEEPSLKKSVVIFATGAVLVIAGSRLLVFSGIAIASALGVPSVIIGLTIIAVGTSLPELVTAIASARKGVPELSIGNIIGANVLNLALITGLASVINPLTLSVFTRNYSYSWLIVIIFSMMGIFWAKGKMRWKQGVLLLVFYSLYVVGLIFLPGMLK